MASMNELRLGTNIRRHREDAGLTLTELAAHAGLTKGALSKIETGKGSPAIATVFRIAEALGCDLAELFAEAEQSASYALTRCGAGRLITRDGSRFGYSYQSLAMEMSRKAIEPFLLTIRPGDPQGVFHHGGEEFIYMLSGQMEIRLGAEKLRLRKGDALYFDPSHEHSTRVIGAKSARFLCCFVQGGRRPARLQVHRGRS